MSRSDKLLGESAHPVCVTYYIFYTGGKEEKSVSSDRIFAVDQIALVKVLE